jgi:hypothetical protein
VLRPLAIHVEREGGHLTWSNEDDQIDGSSRCGQLQLGFGMEDLIHQIDGSAWGSRARRMGAPPPPLGPARSCPPSNRERPHGDDAGLGEERVWLNLGSRFRPLAPYFARSLSILTRRQASVESLSEWGRQEEEAAMRRAAERLWSWGF